MKLRTVIMILALSSSLANAAQLISALGVVNPVTQKVEVFQSGGLMEDGFSGPSSVCFVGRIESVCAALKNEEARIMNNYRNGQHGYITLEKCEQISYIDEWTDAEQTLIGVQYKRTTDYDSEISMVDKTVQLSIRSCN